MNNSKVLTTLSFKATKESMLPIDKLEKLVGKCTEKNASKPKVKCESRVTLLSEIS